MPFTFQNLPQDVNIMFIITSVTEAGCCSGNVSVRNIILITAGGTVFLALIIITGALWIRYVKRSMAGSFPHCIRLKMVYRIVHVLFLRKRKTKSDPNQSCTEGTVQVRKSGRWHCMIMWFIDLFCLSSAVSLCLSLQDDVHYSSIHFHSHTQGLSRSGGGKFPQPAAEEEYVQYAEVNFKRPTAAT